MISMTDVIPYVATIIPIYTPDGNVADPMHPAYAIVWLILQLLGVQA